MTTAHQDLQYHALRDQIEGILSEGKVHTRRATEWGKVEAYWHIGDALQSHFKGQPRAEYGQQIVHNLSNDIGLGQTILWDILLFRRSLPILPTCGELGWSHIRVVIHQPTHDQRLYYLRAAERERWTVLQLRAAIDDDAYGRHTGASLAVPEDEDPHQGRPLRARFGELYTYRIVPSRNPTAEGPAVDLGFGVTCRAATLGLLHIGGREHGPGQVPATPGTPPTPDRSQGVPEPDQIFTAAPAPDGTLTCTLRSPRTRRYTYPAWVERVIDGDTLIAIVDLGFGFETRPQRLRLRGIDCLEINTQAGRNAREYVREVLAQVGFVVITTHSTDSYGRYLADVRFRPGAPDPQTVLRRGKYLNRELLDRHLARRYAR